MRKRERITGRASYSLFIGIPYFVADSPAFTSLPPIYRALYVDLRRQHNGKNNGDIAAADGILGKLGWSHSTIRKGLDKLIEHGLITKTRQGGIASMSKIPTLYAFTDSPTIDNPSKGIKGAQGSWAFRDFVPEPKKKRARKRDEGSSHAPKGLPLHFARCMR